MNAEQEDLSRGQRIWRWLLEDGLSPWMCYLLGLASLANGLTRWEGFGEGGGLVWILGAVLWFAVAVKNRTLHVRATVQPVNGL